MKNFIKNNWDKIIITTFFFYFLFKIIYFAINIKIGIPNDEFFHYKQILNYFTYNNLFLSKYESISSYHGTFAQSSPFYHFLLGNILHINFFRIPTDIFLRLLNLLISIVNIIYFYKLIKLFLKKKIQQIFAFALYTNILLFTYLAGTLSYDNLINLCTVICFYYFFLFYKTKSHKALLTGLMFLLIGNLTKISFWPLTVLFIIFIIYSLTCCSSYKKIYTILKYKIRLTILLILSLINVFFFSYNLIKYKTIKPSCNQIYSQERCNIDGRIRNKTIDLEKMQLLNKKKYIEWWFYRIENGIFGIEGTNSLQHPSKDLIYLNILFFISLIFFVRKISFNEKKILWSLFFIIPYTCLLLYLNYNSYSTFHGNQYLFLQGRYIFPILPLIIIIFTYYLLFFLPKKIQVFIATTAICYFIYLEFPFYLTHPLKVNFENTITSLDIKRAVLLKPFDSKTKTQQTFTSIHSGLKGINLYMATFGKNKEITYNFQLKNETCENILWENTYKKKINDMAYHSILFSRFPDSKNKKYCFSFEVINTKDLPLGLWVSNKNSKYLAGELIINNKNDKDQRDLVFQLIY